MRDGYQIANLFIDRPDEDFIDLFGKLEDTGLTEENWEARDDAILDLAAYLPVN